MPDIFITTKQKQKSKNVNFDTYQTDKNVPGLNLIQLLGSQNPVIQGNSQGTLYCRCKGAVISDLMVGCETGEELCPNKGWLHPQCCDDLKFLSIEEIDKVDLWFCPECKQQSECIIQDTLQTSSCLNNEIAKTLTQPRQSQSSNCIKEESGSKSQNERSKKSFIINLGNTMQIQNC